MFSLDVDPTTSRVRFQSPHLERVSRSFAYGIARLEPRLRASVGLGYLVCRLLDTIEDAAWTSSEDQLRAFSEFEKFVTEAVIDPLQVRAWAARFPAGISSGEKLLLDDAGEVFEQFASLSSGERAAMMNPVLSMSRGMTAFAKRKDGAGELRLRDLSDVNVYCFFVAGVVGELLTGLIESDLRPIGLSNNDVWKNAVHFGLFLQKVNILKDQTGDEKEGRFLVPDREAVFSSMRVHAEGAFEYLRAIPLARKDYRLFCAWSLYLGLATVPLLRAREAKLSRMQALALGARVEMAISSNNRLEALLADLLVDAFSHTETVTDSVPIPNPSRSREQSPKPLPGTPNAERHTVTEALRAYTGQLDTSALSALLSQV